MPKYAGFLATIETNGIGSERVFKEGFNCLEMKV